MSGKDRCRVFTEGGEGNEGDAGATRGCDGSGAYVDHDSSEMTGLPIIVFGHLLLQGTCYNSGINAYLFLSETFFILTDGASLTQNRRKMGHFFVCLHDFLVVYLGHGSFPSPVCSSFHFRSNFFLKKS